ncbi:MAG: tripartite tricarboxylate transporter permease [Hyphomicrobiaceae bacterium]
MDALLTGIGLVLTPTNILLISAGVIIGILVGALPGLSSPMAIALLIPFTLTLDVVPAISMMAALYCAGTYGGSITAILINTPGAPPAAATSIDGYPMAQRGEAARALGLATYASVVGGILSLFIFLFSAPLLARVALSFTPAEYFALSVFALSMLASISGRSSIRNLISGGVGVLISLVGVHLTTGVERFTFDVSAFTDGISFVPVLIGLFAIAELLNQSMTANRAYELVRGKVMQLPSLQDLKSTFGTLMRSTGIGTFIGILPAEGATVAAIMGYNEAKRWSKTPEKFGTGHPEGIVGPEAANNSATGGAMVPTLALGIPGSASTALILAALVTHGIKPGPHLLEKTPEFLYAIFFSMLIANFAFFIVGFGGAKLFAQVTLIPRTFLWPAVFVFSVIGAYSSASSFVDVWVMLVAGLVGFVMLRHGFGPAPLIMGLILGKLVEETFSQAMIIHDNNMLVMMQRPIVALLFVLTAFSLFGPAIAAYRRRRKRIKQLEATEMGE